MLTLKRTQLLTDFGPLDPECSCFVCKQYTRAYLSNIFGQTPLAAHLVTYHNLHFLKGFMRRMRQSIIDARFDEFVNDFLESNYENNEYPSWVVDALTDAGVPFRNAPRPCTKEAKALADAAKAAPKDVSYQVKKSHVRQKAKTPEEKEAERQAKRQKKEQETEAEPAAAAAASASNATVDEPPAAKKHKA